MQRAFFAGEYNNLHSGGQRGYGANAIPNTLAAKIMRSHDYNTSQAGKSSTTDFIGGSARPKLAQNKSHIVQTQKNQSPDSDSMQALRNTDNSSSIADSHQTNASTQSVNQAGLRTSSSESTAWPQAQRDNSSVRPKQSHALQADAGSGYVTGHLSTSARPIQHMGRNEYKNQVTEVTKLTKAGATTLLRKANNDTSPVNNTSGISASGISGEGETTSAKIHQEIRSQLKPGTPLLATKSIEKPSINLGSVIVQRRYGRGRSSQPIVQAAPRHSDIVDKSLDPSFAISTANSTSAADLSPSESSKPAVSGVFSGAIDSVAHSVTNPPNTQNFNRKTAPNTIQPKTQEQKNRPQQPFHPAVFMNRGIVQRNKKVAKSATNVDSNKAPELKFTQKLSTTSEDIHRSIDRPIESIPVLRSAAATGVIPVSYLNPKPLAAVEQHRVTSASPVVSGRQNAQGKNKASSIGGAQNPHTSVLMRSANIGLPLPNHNGMNLKRPTHQLPKRGAMWLVPSLSTFTPDFISRQNISLATHSRASNQSEIVASELPVVSRFGDRAGQAVMRNNIAFENPLVSTPLIRPKTTHNGSAHFMHVPNTTETSSGITQLQTANETGSNATGMQSSASNTGPVGEPTPAADTTSAASQIMQLEQHELEYLARQIYEIIEDRLELERESMGLM
ncbi:MAG: hypothetical protein PVJ72_02945 [Gammaproteobacteria bacterium]